MICVLAPIHGIRWMVDYANSEIPNTNREPLVCDEKDRVFPLSLKAEPLGIANRFAEDKGGRIHGVAIIEKQGHEVTNESRKGQLEFPVKRFLSRINPLISSIFKLAYEDYGWSRIGFRVFHRGQTLSGCSRRGPS